MKIELRRKKMDDGLDGEGCWFQKGGRAREEKQRGKDDERCWVMVGYSSNEEENTRRVSTEREDATKRV